MRGDIGHIFIEATPASMPIPNRGPGAADTHDHHYSRWRFELGIGGERAVDFKLVNTRNLEETLDAVMDAAVAEFKAAVRKRLEELRRFDEQLRAGEGGTGDGRT